MTSVLSSSEELIQHMTSALSLPHMPVSSFSPSPVDSKKSQQLILYCFMNSLYTSNSWRSVRFSRWCLIFIITFFLIHKHWFFCKLIFFLSFRYLFYWILNVFYLPYLNLCSFFSFIFILFPVDFVPQFPAIIWEMQLKLFYLHPVFLLLRLLCLGICSRVNSILIFLTLRQLLWHTDWTLWVAFLRQSRFDMRTSSSIPCSGIILIHLYPVLTVTWHLLFSVFMVPYLFVLNLLNLLGPIVSLLSLVL